MSHIELVGKNASGKLQRIGADGTKGIKVSMEHVIGEGNNAVLGDSSEGLRTYLFGHDSVNGKMRLLKTDATGRLETSVDALEITAETINLSTDNLETLITATNTKLDTDLNYAGQPNGIGDGNSMKRNLTYGYDQSGGQMRPIKVDSIGKVIVDTPTGSDIDVRLGAITTAINLHTVNDFSSGTLLNNITLTNGAINSTTLDLGASTVYNRGVSFFGKCNMSNSTDNFGVWYSNDGTNYYKFRGVRPALSSIDSMYHFGGDSDSKTARYIRIANDCGTDLTNFTLNYVKSK